MPLGEQELTRAVQKAVALAQQERAPSMVPVYAHRYLPAGRGASGHPVLSIYQTDIIIYGTDPAEYIYREFGSGAPVSEDWTPPPLVPFWREFL